MALTLFTSHSHVFENDFSTDKAQARTLGYVSEGMSARTLGSKPPSWSWQADNPSAPTAGPIIVAVVVVKSVGADVGAMLAIATVAILSEACLATALW